MLAEIGRDPSPYAIPDLFMNELLAVLYRLPGSRSSKVQEALSLVEALGMARIGNGHELLALAADFAERWKLSGSRASVYVPHLIDIEVAGLLRRYALDGAFSSGTGRRGGRPVARTSGFSERDRRIDDREEREPAKVGVAGADPADAMLSHQYRRMHVVHHVAPQIGQFRQGSGEDGRMTRCGHQH